MTTTTTEVIRTAKSILKALQPVVKRHRLTFKYKWDTLNELNRDSFLTVARWHLRQLKKKGMR